MAATGNNGLANLKPFPKGVSGNPSGRSKVMQSIEIMLDEEHRTVESVRPVFNKLRALALDGEEVNVYDKEGNLCGTNVVHNSGFFKLYLERVLGAVPKPKDDAQVAEIAKRLLSEMVAEARARREPNSAG